MIKIILPILFHDRIYYTVFNKVQFMQISSQHVQT